MSFHGVFIGIHDLHGDSGLRFLIRPEDIVFRDHFDPGPGIDSDRFVRSFPDLVSGPVGEARPDCGLIHGFIFPSNGICPCIKAGFIVSLGHFCFMKSRFIFLRRDVRSGDDKEGLATGLPFDGDIQDVPGHQIPGEAGHLERVMVNLLNNGWGVVFQFTVHGESGKGAPAIGMSEIILETEPDKGLIAPVFRHDDILPDIFSEILFG